MLEIIRSDDGEIKAVCEWYPVDIDGNFDKNGELVWINEIEVAPKYRHMGLIKEFIKKIVYKYPRGKFGYFWRQRKYPEKGLRIYHKAQWLKLIGGK